MKSEQPTTKKQLSTVNCQLSTIKSSESFLLKNVVWHEGTVTYDDRCEVLGQKGLVVWFTGLSGSGKSTVAVEVERGLNRMGKAVYRLDGDNIRHGLNSDLGFSKADRDENIRRIAEVAALFKDAGLIVLVCFISPYRQMREFAKAKIGEAGFLEVYVKADLKTCEARDPKGLYQKARQGAIPVFTGISDPYEEPPHPDLELDTLRLTVEDAAAAVIAKIQSSLEF
jgi:adenylylsulfate kinase